MLANNVPKMVAAGARLVLGTDAGITSRHAFGWADHHEMARWVELGLTPAQAIVAATSRPAELLGIADMGTLAAGKSADFIVLTANPLDDIRNTRRIASVYLRGARLDRDALAATFRNARRAAMNTRRQFLITAPLGALGAAVACRSEPQSAAVPRAAADAGRAADLRHRAGVGPRGVAVHVRRGGKARAGDDERGRARDGGGELAAVDGAAARAARRARGRSRSSRRRAGDALESGARRRERRARRAIASSAAASAAVPLPAERRRHRVRAGDAALALDRAEGSSPPSA